MTRVDIISYMNVMMVVAATKVPWRYLLAFAQLLFVVKVHCGFSAFQTPTYNNRKAGTNALSQKNSQHRPSIEAGSSAARTPSKFQLCQRISTDEENLKSEV